MQIKAILNLCEKYNLQTDDIACIALNMQFENMTFAFQETKAKGKKYRHLAKAAALYFTRDDVKRFIENEKHNFWSADMDTIDDKPEQEKEKNNNNTAQKDHFVPLSAGIELTKDNIKQVLEQELSKTTDPEKRTALLIRVADFLSLNDSGNVDFEKPVIYLPDRIAENAL